MTTISFARHQFPPAIIRHAVWLYLRFTLSYRDVEDLLAERGLDVSYESVRRWVLKFGPPAGSIGRAKDLPWSRTFVQRASERLFRARAIRCASRSERTSSLAATSGHLRRTGGGARTSG